MKKSILLVLVIVSGLALFKAKSFMQAAAQAYLYGYPIVIMEETRKSMQAGYPEAHKRVNHFTHIQTFPDHNFRNVVRPNVDTLYSIAWLDLSAEPVVLSVPDTQGRYYVMPFMDAWTNVFASVGTREQGSTPGQYLIAGPDWNGEVQKDYKLISAPSNMSWLIGRFQTNGVQDIANVSNLQKQFYLSSLSDSMNQVPPTNYSSPSKANTTQSSAIDPYKLVDAMPAIEFMDTLTKLINAQGAPNEDQAALDNIQKLNLNLPIENNSYVANPIKSRLLEKAFAITKTKMRERLVDRSTHKNGWMVRRNGIGRYGTDYPMRAAVAMIGLGALPPEEAAYPNATVDSSDEVLSGQYRYKIHFPADELPPVNAFWSLTMYDEYGFLIKSKINRYALGDRDQLDFNSDGSLDIFLQFEEPQTQVNNWLPTPAGTFAVTLRLYLPQQKFLSGEWRLPPIMKY